MLTPLVWLCWSKLCTSHPSFKSETSQQAFQLVVLGLFNVKRQMLQIQSPPHFICFRILFVCLFVVLFGLSVAMCPYVYFIHSVLYFSITLMVGSCRWTWWVGSSHRPLLSSSLFFEQESEPSSSAALSTDLTLCRSKKQNWLGPGHSGAHGKISQE